MPASLGIPSRAFEGHKYSSRVESVDSEQFVHHPLLDMPDVKIISYCKPRAPRSLRYLEVYEYNSTEGAEDLGQDSRSSRSAFIRSPYE